MKSSQQEIKFLAGPQSRWEEFRFTVRILIELIRGFRTLHFVGPCVTFFGSARFREDHEYYRRTRELAAEVARLGFTIMTGGGPGLMEAANRGARDVGGRSVGCNIQMPADQVPNKYLDIWVTIKDLESLWSLLSSPSHNGGVTSGKLKERLRKCQRKSDISGERSGIFISEN